MTEKRTIDPKHYGVSGYGNVPAYNLPFTATGHLLYHDGKRESLCGAPAGYKCNRKVEHDPRNEAWAKVCKLCQKVADRDGLVEWVLPPLRKGDCPVLSERTGELTKHIINPVRPRCKNCPKVEWNRFERCAEHHPTYGACSSCGYREPDKHFCDFVVGRSAGISTDFGYCNKGAKAEYQYDRHELNGKNLVWGFLCSIHTPEARKKRKDDWEAKYRAENAAADARYKRQEDKEDAFDILVELARWMYKNQDLIEADEWLNDIALKMATNEALQEALKGKAE